MNKCYFNKNVVHSQIETDYLFPFIQTVRFNVPTDGIALVARAEISFLGNPMVPALEFRVQELTVLACSNTSKSILPHGHLFLFVLFI